MNPNDKPVVSCKRNKLQDIFDYCLDNKIEFNVKEKSMGIDEFEVALDVQNLKKAVLLGMFLRENRMELVGMPVADKAAANKKPAITKKPVESIFEAPKKEEPKVAAPSFLETKTTEATIEEKSESTLSFDLN